VVNPVPQLEHERGPIVGLVLAAGMSRRLGRPKQLLDLAGKPLVMHVVARAIASTLDRVVVVVGHAGDQVAKALRNQDVEIVHNPDFAAGQSTSLIAGMHALPMGTDAIVVLLGDQPLVSTAAIDALIEGRRNFVDPVVMTGYGDVRSHPILFGRELFAELLNSSGDQGAREVIRSHAADVLVVDSGDPTPPADVDTEEAYSRLLETWLHN